MLPLRSAEHGLELAHVERRDSLAGCIARALIRDFPDQYTIYATRDPRADCLLELLEPLLNQRTARVLAEVRDFAETLQMKGGTALYDAVYDSLKHMLAERAKNPRYQYSVVAFTDGENNKGRSIEQFKKDYAALPEDVKGIPVFWVLFGEANEAALKELAQLTGGQVFDARKRSLYSVFKDIRAYQ